MTEPTGAPPAGVSRRAFTVAAAWSLPAVAVSVASPAASASAAFDVFLSFAGSNSTPVASGPRELWLTSNTDGVPVPVGYTVTLGYDPALFELDVTSVVPFTLAGVPGALTLTLQSAVTSDDLMIFTLDYLAGTAPTSGTTTLSATGDPDSGADPTASATVTVA